MARQNLTIKRIRDANCQDDKQQVFLWDADVKGLGVRVTKTARAYIYQGRLSGQNNKVETFRIKIGDCSSVLLEDARNIARQFAAQVAEGKDPRQERKRVADRETADRQEVVRQGTTLGDVWPIYMEDRRQSWSENYYKLHGRLISAGGQQRTRAQGKTIPGPLAGLAPKQISEITADAVKHWLQKEKATRPTQTRIAFEALRTFLNWCESDERYNGLASTDACSAKLKRDHLKKTKRDDCLEKGQLRYWFDSVRRYESRIMSAYIQTLLLTGARREEIMSLQWTDIDFKWGRISIMGKGGVPRDIPLTPYVSSLLYHLPRVNQWVFSAKTGTTGRLQSPTKAFQRMMARAEIEGLTLHGLRRSFSTLSEWIEAPAGIIAQIQGHQPSAIAEKHYKKRPLDLLRMWHTRIEGWMLDQAGITQPRVEEATKTLRIVGA